MGEASAVNKQEDGERHTNYPLSCSYNALQSLAAGHGTGTVPQGDAPGQDDLNVASVCMMEVEALALLSLQRIYRCCLAFFGQ